MSRYAMYEVEVSHEPTGEAMTVLFPLLLSASERVPDVLSERVWKAVLDDLQINPSLLREEWLCERCEEPVDGGEQFCPAHAREAAEDAEADYWEHADRDEDR